jgi:putative colanic acid biosynthesis glycosyltransferase
LNVLKITIVTICRNDLAGLKNTFATIVAQDYGNIEWLVIDGNSSDGTVDWLKGNHKLAGTWISEPDNGIYDAMNKGIRLARGSYILFMNSGDIFAGKDVVTKLIHKIEQERVAPDFVYGDSKDVESNGRANYRKALPVSFINAGMITRHQSMLYRRSSILGERYLSEYRYSGDYALTAKILMREDVQVLRVDFPISEFAMGGLHDKNRILALVEDFDIRKNILQKSLVVCCFWFCIHWTHYHLRMALPSLNRFLIYKSDPLTKNSP